MPGHRSSTRLPGFDYAAPAVYMVTLCTEDRVPILGVVKNAMVNLLAAGEIVHKEWLQTPIIRPEVHLDEFITMPEHFHAILGIGTRPEEIPRYIKTEKADGTDRTTTPVGAHGSAPYPNNNVPNPNVRDDNDMSDKSMIRRPRSLSSLIAQFKSVTTHQINILRRTPGAPVWQRGYDDRIIRNAFQLDKARAYIRNNPKEYSQTESPKPEIRNPRTEN